MFSRSHSQPKLIQPSMAFTNSVLLDSASILGASYTTSLANSPNRFKFSPNNQYSPMQNKLPIRRQLSPVIMRNVDQRQGIYPFIANQQQFIHKNNPIKPKKIYDIILRKGQDFYNFDQDVHNIFKVFSLPSWVSNRYDVSINSFKPSPQGIPCYQTILKVTPKFNEPRTQMYFFEVEKDVINRKVVYYIQSTIQPFRRTNCVVIQGKIDLVNQFLVIKIYDYNDFFSETFERPYQQLFEFAVQGHKINQLSYPYIEPYDITNQQEEGQHYFLIFRGGAARSSAYVGAYKAVLDMYPQYNKKLKGVLSASIGSLLGLMTIFGQSPDFINQVLSQLSFVGQRDKVIKSEAQALQKQVHYEQIQLKIKQVLFDYGIMQTQLFDLLYTTIWSNPLVVSKLITAISGQNATLQQSMTMQTNNVQYLSVLNTDITSQTNLIVPSVIKRPALTNFYGLLDGYLLKGQYIVELASQIVTRFLIVKCRQNIILVAKTLGVHPKQITELTIKVLSKKLTMKQMYILTGSVEFSVTSVDTDSQIMRFLNHKTSPDLPVVNSIQIAFAMPFLVKLPKWKRSWGKYYVHYRNRRKEIDLTGHTFIDGSIIDSSPLIYLQNERLRQIFFARKPNAKSKIMCFGTYLSDQIPEKYTRQSLFQEFFQVLKANVPIKEIIQIATCVPPPTFFPFQSLSKPTDIPLVGLFVRIEQTLKNVSDNIIKETFSVRSHLFPENYSFADYFAQGKTPYMLDQRYRAYHALRDSVHELRDQLFSLNLNRVAILKVLAEIIQKLDQPQYQQDPKYILRIKSNVLQQVSSHAMYAAEQKKRKNLAKSRGGIQVAQFDSYIDQLQIMLVDVLDDVRLIYRFGYFFRERFLMHDAQTLQNTIRKLIDVYTIDQKAPLHIKNHLKVYIQNIFMVRKLQEYNQLNSLALYLDKLLLNMQNGNFNTYNPKLYKLNQIFRNFRLESMPQFLQFCLRLEQLKEPLIIQDRAFERQRQHSRFYIDGTLKRRSSNNLHIVFQSQGFHSKYLVKAYQQINQVITFDHFQALDDLYEQLARMIIKQNQQIRCSRNQKNIFCSLSVQDLVKFIIVRADLNQQLRKIMASLQKYPIPSMIDLGYIKYEISQNLGLKLQKTYYNHFKNRCAVKAITTSGFSAFFAFLIAAGVDADTIEQQLWSFRSHFEFNENQIFKEYNKMDWCLKEDLLIRDMQDLLWRSRYDVWGNMERAAQQYRIKLDLDHIKSQFQESRQPIMKSFTDVMSHVITSARQSTFEKNPQQFFAQANSLRVYQNFYEINKGLSAQTKNVISMLMSMFQEQIRVIIMHLSLQKVQQVIQLQEDPIKRQAMWRGVVILSFLKSDKYKRHIQATLKKINLPSQIKLRQFYDVNPTKIDLSVNAIDFTQGKYVFINRYTYPQMPLWAAILIGASHPLLFAQVHSRKSWHYHISLQNTQRTRRLFFNEIPQSQRRAPLFGSGSLVDSFPLSLLTNQKVLQSSFDKKSYTFLNFGLRTVPQRNYQMIGFYCRRFFDMNQLRILFSGPSKVVYISQLSKLFMKHSNMLQSYVTSHDKLMQELYSSQVIKLPSRVDFLQYFRLVPSDQLNFQTQQQAYFSTRQKFSPSTRMSFFQVKYTEYKIEIFFISKDRFRYDIFSDYNIYFKFRQQDRYEQIPLQYLIEFNLTQYQNLYLRYSFLQNKELLIKNKEFIMDFTTLRNFIKLDAVYQLNYTDVFNKLTAPFRVYDKILKVPSTNIYGDQIIIRSNIDVKKHGLYCQICCSSLVLNKLMFLNSHSRHKCLSCEKVKLTKFKCQTPNCHGAYCLNCLKDQMFLKHFANTTCIQGHPLVFKGTKSNKQPKQFVRCECCFAPNSFYYEDTVCRIKICNSCFSEINVDTQNITQ